MYMPLVSSENGCVSFSKPAGSTLQNGDVIGHLRLDDPTLVKRAKLFEGNLPEYR